MFNKQFTFWGDIKLFMAIIGVLVLIVGLYENLFLPVGLGILFLVYFFSQKNYRSKEAWFNNYLDTVVRNIERANNYAAQQMPVGIAVFDTAGKLQWKNELFQTWVTGKAVEGSTLSDILPPPENNFAVLSQKDVEKQIKLGDRMFMMTVRRVLTQEDGGKETGLCLYLVDVTDRERQKKRFDDERLCIAYLQFDNYSDVMKGLSESTRANITVEVNRLISQWADEQDGVFTRYAEDLFTVSITKAALRNTISKKFEVLDKIREIKAGNKIPPTISIGLACEEKTLQILGQQAQAGLDLALGRGGDQAVVSIGGEMQFFGGKSSVQAKSTRVRARIVAQAIHELMINADKIFVMGHVNEDYDSLGSALGVAKMALSLGKETYVVTSGRGPSLERMEELATEADANYKKILLSSGEALPLVTHNSILFIVDHHRAMLSASQEILQAVDKKVIIDHHRRAEDIIKNSILNYMEPSSSSTSELVTELLTYFDDRMEFTKTEASALYAGIVVDTKNFAVQTGERTFEAAAYLRRNGADPSLVHQLFKDDMETVVQRAKLIAGARVPLPGIAIAVYKEAPVDKNTSIIVAQTADELLTMNDISVSIVMAETTEGLGISARSDGTVNVQVMMEELGGGGHQTVAGVQLQGATAATIEPQILELASQQLKERVKNESDTTTRS
ncbi:MAG: DHH family phosphoesterase [Acidaminococcaceae bacterium]